MQFHNSLYLRYYTRNYICRKLLETPNSSPLSEKTPKKINIFAIKVLKGFNQNFLTISHLPRFAKIHVPNHYK